MNSSQKIYNFWETRIQFVYTAWFYFTNGQQNRKLYLYFLIQWASPSLLFAASTTSATLKLCAVLFRPFLWKMKQFWADPIQLQTVSLKGFPLRRCRFYCCLVALPHKNIDNCGRSLLCGPTQCQTKKRSWFISELQIRQSSLKLMKQ